MLDWISGFKKTKNQGLMPSLHIMAILLANAARLEPDLYEFADLAGTLLFGPLVPAQFRLQGHGSRPDAKEIYLQNNPGKVSAIGDLSEQQLDQLKAIAGILKEHTSLRRLIESI
jgi:hypothetical protein